MTEHEENKRSRREELERQLEEMKKLVQPSPPASSIEGTSPTGGEITEDLIAFGRQKAAQELETVRQAWLKFQETIKDLGIYAVIETYGVNPFTSGMIFIERSLQSPDDDANIEEIAEWLMAQGHILELMLNKYHIK